MTLPMALWVQVALWTLPLHSQPQKLLLRLYWKPQKHFFIVYVSYLNVLVLAGSC
jgi:hypothetical protein